MVLVVPAFTVPARNGGLPSSVVGEVRPRASGSTIKEERWRGNVCVCVCVCVCRGGGGVRSRRTRVLVCLYVCFTLGAEVTLCGWRDVKIPKI